MAGIGFELKKLFSHKGIILQIRANLYASIVITGPMLLGAALLFLIKFLAVRAGSSPADQDALVVMTTWSLLFSLLLTSIFTFGLARYTSDMLYEQEPDRILPSMYGAISLCLLIGAIPWGVFLYISQIPLDYAVFTYLLFCEAVVVWTQISYTNAVKDYRQVMLGFVYGFISAFATAVLFIWILSLPVVTSLLASVCIAYAVMMFHFTLILHAYFSIGKGSALRFFHWMIKYPQLVFVGFFATLGLFGHIIMMWFSPWGTPAIGYFYHAPQHDIPALLAFMTILVTTVNFVTSVEVKFYNHYRIYFSLLNGNGSLSDIEKAFKDLLTILKQELFYLAQVQLFVTIVSIVVIGEVILNLGLGFNLPMVGLFRVLCVGYGLYAIGNVFMIFSLYLADFRGAMITALTLAVVNLSGTLFTITLPESYYGFGFVAAGLVMYLIGWWQLVKFIKKLDYHVYCKQPIFVNEKSGPLTRLIVWMDKRNLERKAEIQ